MLEAGGEQLAIISADLTFRATRDAEGAWAYLGQGRVYPSLRKALREHTERLASMGIVWAAHFPPEFRDIAPGLRLLDDQDLVALARELYVEHLFCGHTYEQRRNILRGEPNLTVYCAGTATQYCAPTPHVNFIHPTEIDVEGGKVIAVRWRRFGLDPNENKVADEEAMNELRE